MKTKKIDWNITLIPLIFNICLCILFILIPLKSNSVLSRIRLLLGNVFTSYYLIFGVIVFIISIYLSFSKLGNTIIGKKNEKPKYSFFTWGTMMFTCGLAADIIFYSFSEWILYAKEPYVNELGGLEWTKVLSLYHWSLIPWSFYLVLSVAFGYMIYVKKRKRKSYSESCRAVLGKYIDKMPGKIIDLLAVFAIIAGTATTLSIATPLMSEIICSIFNVQLNNSIISIIILLITCAVYTYSLYYGIDGISKLSKVCIYLFFFVLIYVLFCGGQTKFIIVNGFKDFERMIQSFVRITYFKDSVNHLNFSKTWTMYYWAYWISWCVVVPFFIGNISRGRTIKQVILGGYLFGTLSTIISFIILENYSISLQMSNSFDFVSLYHTTGDIYSVILEIIKTLPHSKIFLIVMLITMIAFYATSFDTIAYSASCYSYKELKENETPDNVIQLIWCILLILLPIGLIFSKSSLTNLQSVSIIASFPISIIILIIIISFFKDLKSKK